MSDTRKIIKIHPSDSVAVVLEAVKSGDCVAVDGA